jgi:hypothetical protein
MYSYQLQAEALGPDQQRQQACSTCVCTWYSVSRYDLCSIRLELVRRRIVDGVQYKEVAQHRAGVRHRHLARYWSCLCVFSGDTRKRKLRVDNRNNNISVRNTITYLHSCTTREQHCKLQYLHQPTHPRHIERPVAKHVSEKKEILAMHQKVLFKHTPLPPRHTKAQTYPPN